MTHNQPPMSPAPGNRETGPDHSPTWREGASPMQRWSQACFLPAAPLSVPQAYSLGDLDDCLTILKKAAGRSVA